MKTLSEGNDRQGVKVVVLLGILIFSAGTGRAAGTNEIHFDVLVAGGESYTNATIIRANPAYAVVTYQDGILRVPMSNLPPMYQTQFGYTPEKAAQFLAEEARIQKARRAAVAAQQQAYQQAVTTLAGTNRPIQITAVLDANTYGGMPLCSVDGIPGGILVRNLPDSVGRFLADYRQIQVDIAAATRRVKELDAAAALAQNTTTWAIERGTEDDFINARAKQKTIYNDQLAAENQLDQFNARWEQMQKDYNSLTTILAYPTGQFYGQKPIWICSGAL